MRSLAGDKSLCYLLYHIAISLADCSLAICDVKGKKSHKSAHFSLYSLTFQFHSSLDFPSREDWKVKTYLKFYRYNWGFFFGQHILNQASIFHKFSSFSLYVFRIFYIRANPEIKETHLSLLFLFSSLSNCSWASNDKFKALLVSTHQQAIVVSWRATA